MALTIHEAVQELVEQHGGSTLFIDVLAQTLAEQLQVSGSVEVAGELYHQHKSYRELDRAEVAARKPFDWDAVTPEPFHKVDQVAYEAAVDRGGW